MSHTSNVAVAHGRGPILVTGSSGLVGAVLCAALQDAGIEVRGLDLRGTGAWRGDMRDSARLAEAMSGCRGVVHLAAVSRVLLAEQDPELCWQTNVVPLRRLLEQASQQTAPPWVVFASSREVYGDAAVLPVRESQPPAPRNTYARSKQAGETLIAQAAAAGLRAMTVRLSNVYGRTWDHADRVVPAFARAAVMGMPLRVDGAAHCFDFTQVDDVVRGLVRLVAHLDAGGAALPPIHFVTQRGITLGELAALANRLAGSRVPTRAGAPSGLHVQRFVGSGERACALLGWTARCSIEAGLARLMADFRAELAPAAAAGRAVASFSPAF